MGEKPHPYRAPLKYIVVDHRSSGGHFTDWERGQFPQWVIYLDVRITAVFLPFSRKFALLVACMRNICNTCPAAWSRSGWAVWWSGSKTFGSNRRILRILLDHSSGQPRNQGLSRVHDKGFFRGPPTLSFTFTILRQLGKKKKSVPWNG